MPETDFDIECPYCHRKHELAESIDCPCGAHGTRRLQGKLLGWLFSRPTKRAPDRLTAWAGGVNFIQCFLAGGGSVYHRRQVTQAVSPPFGEQGEQDELRNSVHER